MWRESVLAAVLLAGGGAPAGTAAQPLLPPTPGWELVQSRCVICHSLEIATQQRLGPEGWAENVDRMIRYGAPIPPADRQAILEYLLRHFRDPDGR
jgi:Quinohemoprotein amine dehydrogenase A, alpha subunit, haem binding